MSRFAPENDVMFSGDVLDHEEVVEAAVVRRAFENGEDDRGAGTVAVGIVEQSTCGGVVNDAVLCVAHPGADDEEGIGIEYAYRANSY